VTASGDRIKAVPMEETIMRYYANAIGHWLQHE
jgi:hypothetical protein